VCLEVESNVPALQLDHAGGPEDPGEPQSNEEVEQRTERSFGEPRRIAPPPDRRCDKVDSQAANPLLRKTRFTQ
jgi:hypothetical protein